MRLFVAIPLPEDIEQTLVTLTSGLREAVPSGVRWVPANNIHLTLKFLGEQPVGRRDVLCSVIERASGCSHPFSVSVGGLGCFPGLTRPRVLWVGLNDAQERLAQLQRELETGFGEIGIPREQRPFHPHLTIGRMKRDFSSHDQQELQAAIQAHGDRSIGRWVVQEIVLYQSDLRPQGAVYSRMGTFPLGGN